MCRIPWWKREVSVHGLSGRLSKKDNPINTHLDLKQTYWNFFIYKGSSDQLRKVARMRLRGSRIKLDRPRRVIIGRVYEKFKPIFEWIHEDDHDVLLIYILGFRKEFIKVTSEHPNILRIRGERLVTGIKWDRFQEYFTVPENCKKSEIRAKLDGGILIITMPKKINASTKLGEPTKTAKQAIDSSKPTPLTLNVTLPPQPPVVNNDGTKPNDQGKAEPLIEKIGKRKTGYNTVLKRLTMGGMKEGRVVVVNMVVAVMLVATALGVYVSYFIRASSEWNQLSNIL